MKKNAALCLLFLLLLTAGCGSRPAPVWIASGHQQLENFKTDFLTGRASLVTELHFKKAVEEIKKGGDLDLLGKAWLTRMALQVAVLGEMEDDDYQRVEAAQTVSANRNFYLFLSGDAAKVEGSLLPEQYRPFLAALKGQEASPAERTIAAIEDPLSRLIAAGLAVRHRLVAEAILRTAVETAAQEGWKRALIAWLEHLQAFHAAAGETAKASAIRQRIDLIQ
jgi:hypothetical protein